MAALTSLISGCDTIREQARTSAKRYEHSREWICALLKCSINQNQSNQNNRLSQVKLRPDLIQHLPFSFFFSKKKKLPPFNLSTPQQKASDRFLL
jgi:hypothetical protein